jgi:hypothetical protein
MVWKNMMRGRNRRNPETERNSEIYKGMKCRDRQKDMAQK